MYKKDSLLNSNPAFDYGAFRGLAATSASQSDLASPTSAQNGSAASSGAPSIPSGKEPPGLFAFTFTEPGVYVFATSANPEYESVVAVQVSGSSSLDDDPPPLFLFTSHT